jgi:hypothetical protein
MFSAWLVGLSHCGSRRYESSRFDQSRRLLFCFCGQIGVGLENLIIFADKYKTYGYPIP